MSNDLMLMDVQLPAHLQAAQLDSTTDSLMVTGPTFPRLSIKNSKFRLKKDGEERVIKLDEFNVVIIAATPLSNKPAKVFYKEAYSGGDDSAPTCMSSDGIRPDASVESPQCATTCAQCPQNAWGSGTKADGSPSEGKACKDTKALYFVVPKGDGLIDEVIQLRVPTMSLKHLSKYANLLKHKKIPITSVITKLSFNDDAEYPELMFNFGGFLSESQFNKANEIQAGDVIAQVLQGEVSIAESTAPAVEPTPEPAPTPVAAVEEDDDEDDFADLLGDIEEKPAKRPVAETVAEAKKEVQSSLFDDDLGEVDDEEEDDVEVDADGRPWDERIDSSNKKKSKKTNKWMRRKNLADDYYVSIKAELMGKSAPAPSQPAQPVVEAPAPATVVEEPADTDIDDDLDALLADLV